MRCSKSSSTFRVASGDRPHRTWSIALQSGKHTQATLRSVTTELRLAQELGNSDHMRSQRGAATRTDGSSPGNDKELAGLFSRLTSVNADTEGIRGSPLAGSRRDSGLLGNNREPPVEPSVLRPVPAGPRPTCGRITTVTDPGVLRALYSYDGDSDDLTLASSGGGGLLNIAGAFESSRVMYGFCSVKDAASALPRYVLINWVGEDVPDARKCACASHVATVAEFFQGVNVIVNASNMEDIDPSAIGQRLTNGTTAGPAQYSAASEPEKGRTERTW
ncbi:unnamed protein product [Lota lota]